MDIENVVKQIDSLEKGVQNPVNAYVDDADFTWLPIKKRRISGRLRHEA